MDLNHLLRLIRTALHLLSYTGISKLFMGFIILSGQAFKMTPRLFCSTPSPIAGRERLKSMLLIVYIYI